MGAASPAAPREASLRSPRREWQELLHERTDGSALAFGKRSQPHQDRCTQRDARTLAVRPADTQRDASGLNSSRAGPASSQTASHSGVSPKIFPRSARSRMWLCASLYRVNNCSISRRSSQARLEVSIATSPQVRLWPCLTGRTSFTSWASPRGRPPIAALAAAGSSLPHTQ